VVGVFQVLVSHLPLHWSIKLPMVLAGSFTVLFGSYQLLVRYTWLGAILNGRKFRGSPGLPAVSHPAQQP
jgi:hypothetical protein